MGNKKQPWLSNNRHWQTLCNNKNDKEKVLSGEPLESSAKATTHVVQPKAGGADDFSGILSLVQCFDEIKDPRINRTRVHNLIDIIVISICAVICNADGWADMRTWAGTHRKWLEQFLELPGGLPSRDTLRRTISRLDPQAFQQAFLKWLKGLRKQLGKVIAIDGKTLRGSKAGGNKPLHIVSAWASDQHLTLGQTTVDKKSNEITAIPQLLDSLTLCGAIVTIDAMGCQRDIAAKIIERKGQYCLAVKGNQEKLHERLQAEFEKAMSLDRAPKRLSTHEVSDAEKKPHGRYEHRVYHTMPAPQELKDTGDWKNLRSIGLTITYRSDNPTNWGDGEVRYFIMSFGSDAERFGSAVRQHWGIENSLHWVMDVTFREDESRIRKDYGAENVSWLRRLAITLIKHNTTRKASIRQKRLRAGYDFEFFLEILNSVPIAN
jgi:predicted transposase YbfD/YdcC